MSELTAFSPVPATRRNSNLCAATSCVPWVILIALLVLAGPARGAENPEDEYLRIYGIVQQADSLQSSGEKTQAVAKYEEAQKALRNLQTRNPSWNAQVVSFRLDYVSEKITSLGKKASNTPEGNPATTQPQTSGEAPQASPLPGTRLKLLDPGAEPRRVLRLHPKPGSKQTLELSMKMNMQLKVGEMENQVTDLPTMKLTMDAVVKEVSAEGDISYEVVMGEASVPEGAGLAPQIAEAIKSSFDGIKGLSGTGKISNRGFDKGTRMNLPADATPQMRQTADQMKDTISRLAPELPEEPVGPGARWEIQMPVRSQGMTLDQTAMCQLVSVEGDRITTKSTITQRAAKQKIENPAMPGLKMDLEKMSGNGAGEGSFDLAQLLPLEGKFELQSDMSMGMTINGEKQAMAMKMGLKLQLQAK